MSHHPETAKEYGLNEIWEISWSVFTTQFKPILFITLLIYIPVNIILLMLESTLHYFADLKFYYDAARLLEALFGVLATMGIAVVVENALHASEINWIEAVNRAFSRWGSCLLTNALQGLIIFGLTLLLIVPGVVWALYYAFAIQVVVLREIRGKRALDYSKSMVKGRWWKVFGILLLFGVAIFAVTLGIGYVLSWVPGIRLFSGILIDVIAAFFSVVTTVLFLHLEYLYNKRQEEEQQAQNAESMEKPEPGVEANSGVAIKA